MGVRTEMLWVSDLVRFLHILAFITSLRILLFCIINLIFYGTIFAYSAISQRIFLEESK